MYMYIYIYIYIYIFMYIGDLWAQPLRGGACVAGARHRPERAHLLAPGPRLFSV